MMRTSQALYKVRKRTVRRKVFR